MSLSKDDLSVLEARLERVRADLVRVLREGAPRQTIDAAAARFDEARSALREALGKAAPGEAAPELPSTLTGHLFGSPGSAGSAEATRGKTLSGKRVAVCLSGGGTRAASCSMGALRALRQLGLLDKVQYLSTVSGGGWAGSLYMYAPYSDDELLGPYVPPQDVSKLRWSTGPAPYNQDVLGAHAIGQFCTQIGWDALVAGTIELAYKYGFSLPAGAYWPRLIGRYVLEGYGLGDWPDSSGRPTRYYTIDPSWFEVVVQKNNPTLSRSSFYFSNTNRPFWLANSTFNAPGVNPDPYPFWQTQLDVGIYPRFPGQGIGGLDLGGGSIDPFTFESASPVSYGNGLFLVRTPQGQYALSDPVGTSSAAFGVELFSRLPDEIKRLIGDITPKYSYWPVMSPSQPAQTYDLSDGAGLDNQAICGLLGWAGVDSILSFVNTDEAVVVNTSLPFGDIDAVQMDTSVPPLFGWIWDSGLNGYRYVTQADGTAFYLQVFPTSSFADLVQGLRDAVSGGGAAVAKIKTQTVPNSRFGVAGGNKLDVLFVFNYQAPSFYSQLDWEIRWGLTIDYPLVTFPYFDTVRDLNLNARAVNLLANLMSWSVATNESLVRSMFGIIT